MIKSIRNNWINCKDKIFYYPNFNDNTKIQKADFSILEDVYNMEKGKLLKLASLLTSAAINPTNIERQKVYLALKIFDEKTAAALRVLGSQADETADFIDIIVKFWKIFNINTTSKYKDLCDPFSKPFDNLKSENDLGRINWLSDFLKWLEAWKNIKGRMMKLTPFTFLSVSHSCKSLKSFIEYALNTLIISFILTSKLQTDCLEGQFGEWRETNGGSFHLTYCQILSKASAKRALNSLKLTNKIINLENIEIENVSNQSNCFELSFLDSLDIDLNDLTSKPFYRNYMISIVYIGGYVLSKNIDNNTCLDCYNQFLFNEEIDCEFFCSNDYKDENNVYFMTNSLNRKKLKKPSNIFCMFLYNCFIIFKEEVFPKISNINNLHQLSTKKIIEFFINIAFESDFFDEIIICQKNDIIFLRKCLKNFTNIILNNYTKIVNDLFDFSLNKGIGFKNSNYIGDLQITKYYN